MIIDCLGFRIDISRAHVRTTSSIGVNAVVPVNSDDKELGYTEKTFPRHGVDCAATQTLQSDFYGCKLAAAAHYSGYYVQPGGEPVLVHAQQPGGIASDVILKGVFVGGYNACPLPPGTGLNDGGISLAAFPPNGRGNGIDMLPGKIGQVVKCPLLIMPSVFSLFEKVPADATLYLRDAVVFLTFFDDDKYKTVSEWTVRLKRLR